MEIVQNDLGRIASKVTEYQSILSGIADKRNQWRKETKSMIYDTLLRIKSSFDLDWSVHKEENCENLKRSICGLIKRSAA